MLKSSSKKLQPVQLITLLINFCSGNNLCSLTSRICSKTSVSLKHLWVRRHPVSITHSLRESFPHIVVHQKIPQLGMPLGQCASTSVCFLRRVKPNLCHMSYVSNQHYQKSCICTFNPKRQLQYTNRENVCNPESLLLLYAVIPSSCAFLENKLIWLVLL